MRGLFFVLLPAIAGSQYTGDFCLERHRCSFYYVDPNGREYSWDLSTLCKPNGTYQFSGEGTEGQTFFFNVCGNTSQVCSDYQNTLPFYESHGVATQMFQIQRGVRANAATSCLREDNLTACPDWTFGGDTCCSVRRCEVVALEAFTFDLVNISNPANGGIVLTHMGMPQTDDDTLLCPMVAVGSTLRRLRSFILTLVCDPNGAVDDLTVVKYDETSQYCVFRVTATTRAACAVLAPSPSPTPVPSASSTPSSSPPNSAENVIARLTASGSLVGSGGQFGYTVLGIVLAGSAQLAYGLWAQRRRAGAWAGVNVAKLSPKRPGSGGAVAAMTPDTPLMSVRKASLAGPMSP